MFPPAGVLQSQYREPWTPAAISPTIWVDDTSIVTSGSNIIEWTNMGSLGNAFTAASASPQTGATLNSLPVVDFIPNDRMIADVALEGFLNNVTYAWIFMIHYLDSASGDEVLVQITENTGTGSRWSYLGGLSSIAQMRSGSRRTDGGTFSSATSVSTTMTGAWFMTLGINDYGNNQIRLYIDGALDRTTNSAWSGTTGNTDSTDSNVIWLGAYANSTSYFDGRIAETFWKSANGSGADLSQSDIDKMFGFAAHKWGLTGSLDAGHPYKTNPPTV